MAELITKETYKQAKALTGAKDDERLDLIASSVSQLVKTYCNNSLMDYSVSPYTEFLTIDFKTNCLILTESPVLVVSEVWERPSATEVYVQLATDGTAYTLDRRADTLSRVDASWPLGVEAIKVVYTAGYSVLPTDLRLALIDLMAYYFKEEHKVTRQLGSGSMTNPRTSLEDYTGFPDHIKRILDLYRQV
jgi:hypothetical protein